MFEAAAPATAAAAVTSVANSRCSPLPPRAQRCRPLLLLAKPAGGGQRTAREGVSPSPQLPPAVLVAAATAVAVAAAEAASMANATTAAVGVAAVTAVPLPRADCLPPPDRSPPHVVRPWMACIRWRGRADGRRALSAPPLPVLLVFLCGGRRRGGGGKGQDRKGGETAAYATAAAPTAAAAVPPPPPRSHLRRMVLSLAPSPLSPLPVPLTAIPIDCSFPPPRPPAAGRPVLFGQSMQWMGRSGTAWRRLCQPTPPLLPPLRPQTLRAPCLMVVKAAVPTFDRGVGRWTCWRGCSGGGHWRRRALGSRSSGHDWPPWRRAPALTRVC